MATTTHDVKKDITSSDNQKIEDLAEKTSNSSAEIEAQNVELDDREAARVLRKVDLRLVPMLSLLYLVAFIDRSNIVRQTPYLGKTYDITKIFRVTPKSLV